MSNISPMTVGGVRHLVERAYRESGALQYLRELLVNALEAGAKHVEFGPEWQAVERDGVYRLMVADDGKGMQPEELLKFLNTFGGGGKPIGDAHENFGVGSKTSLLPWNHAGVVVISWTPECPQGSMVWLARDSASGEYGARKFETAEGTFEEVVAPFGEWVTIKPDWIAEHGTVVICLGDTGREDTFLGKTGEGDTKGINAYLNKRIWEIPGGVEIRVQELRSQKRSEWPRSLTEASQGAQPANGPDRRWNRRHVRGANHYLTYQAETGKLTAQGTVPLEDGTEIDWYLWDERPAIHSYAHKDGYVAALYKNELYDTQTHLSVFRSFGIPHAKVRANLTLIARPPQATGSYGVYPDTARNALKIQGHRRAGEPLPWSEWAQEFAESLPGEIKDAIARAMPNASGTLDDASWQSRLVDRFGARWRSLRFFPILNGASKITPDQATGTSGGSKGTGSGSGTGSGGGEQPGHLGAPAEKVQFSAVESPTGTVPGAATRRPGGLPRYYWTTSENLDESGAFAAAWCPPSASAPDGLVQIAKDFPALQEVFKHWRAQYADHLAALVDETIEKVYGEVMVARIAHSELLASNAKWGRQRVEKELRSPAALTMALLGLLSEDLLIASRLSGLGVRRKSA